MFTMEQSENVELLDLSIEMLEHILITLGEKDLLVASHVCKTFAAAAEIAFARKFANERYDIYGSKDSRFHKIILNKYGDKVRDLSIQCVDDEFCDLIEQKCCNSEKVDLWDVARMPKLKDLNEIGLNNIRTLNRETFVEFINNSHELEHLKFSDD